MCIVVIDVGWFYDLDTSLASNTSTMFPTSRMEVTNSLAEKCVMVTLEILANVVPSQSASTCRMTRPFSAESNLSSDVLRE